MERLVTDMTETEILFDLLEKGISPAHAVSACEKRLTDAGFEVVDGGGTQAQSEGILVA